MTALITKEIPLEIFPDDVFLVSYPKSGKTWLRFLIGNYLSGNRWDFPNSYRDIVPDIDYNPQQCSQIQRPRFIQSHWSFTPAVSRVVYLVRDGRDVAVSYYFHFKKFRGISKETRFEDFLEMFNNQGLDNLPIWSSHVNQWVNNASERFLLIKYEDMKVNTVAELTRILEFAGINVDYDAVIAAVKASEFEKLKAYESLQEKILFEDIVNSDLSIKFFRKGEVGESKKFFNDELMAKFIEIHGTALKRLGY